MSIKSIAMQAAVVLAIVAVAYRIPQVRSVVFASGS